MINTHLILTYKQNQCSCKCSSFLLISNHKSNKRNLVQDFKVIIHQKYCKHLTLSVFLTDPGLHQIVDSRLVVQLYPSPPLACVRHFSTLGRKKGTAAAIFCVACELNSFFFTSDERDQKHSFKSLDISRCKISYEEKN